MKPRRQSAQARTALVTRQPYCLRERAAPRELLRSFDKCFAAAWLDDDRCVVGTKDNKLAVVRASNLHAPAHQVPLPRRLFEPPERRSSRTTRPLRPLPPPPPPPPNRVAESRVDDAVARVRAAANHAHHASSNATDVNDAAVNERVRRVRFRGDAPSYDDAQEMDRVRAGAGPHARVVGAGVGWSPRGHADNCGIHAVAINASRTRMATGAANPADAAVFSLPDVRPTALLTGHTDWVFGLDWVTDNLLASGSRDGTVKLWTVPDEPAGYGRGTSGYGRDDDAAAAPSYAQISSDPNDTLVFHYDKVRDLKWCERSGRLVSVSTDGRVCFSDVERVAAVEEKRIRGKRELVCVATDGATCAAGSQSHITVFDHRVGGVVRDERLVDNSSDGVRSLSFAGELAAGVCAGACQVIVTNPLECVKVRLQTTTESSNCFEVVRALGFEGLSTGALACAMRDASFSAILFPTYAHAKVFLPEMLHLQGPASLFLAGLLSAAPAAFLTTPLDVIKTRQLERAFADGGLPSVGDVARSVYDEEGPDVLFSGGFERVLRSAPQFGVTLALYDVLTQYCTDHGWLG